MSLSRRQVVAAIPAAALAAGLPQGPALAQDGRKVVTFWFGSANSDGQAALRNDLVEPFNASQDKYLLQIEIKGAAINNLLKIALVAGNGPDIVQTAGPAYLTAIANAGQVLALDDFAEKYKWKERFLPALLNTSVYGGKLYALPRDYESIHLFYNKEVFSQNGWKLPTNRAEFEQVADAALAKGIIPFGAGNADWKGVNEWLVTVFFNNVAGPDNVRKALAGELPWTAQPFVDAVELSKAWFSKDAGRDEKYDYLYSREELRLWEEAIREMEAEKTFLILNNHFQGKGIANAFMLMKALGKEVVPPPTVQAASASRLAGLRPAAPATAPTAVATSHPAATTGPTPGIARMPRPAP